MLAEGDEVSIVKVDAVIVNVATPSDAVADVVVAVPDPSSRSGLPVEVVVVAMPPLDVVVDVVVAISHRSTSSEMVLVVVVVVVVTAPRKSAEADDDVEADHESAIAVIVSVAVQESLKMISGTAVIRFVSVMFPDVQRPVEL